MRSRKREKKQVQVAQEAGGETSFPGACAPFPSSCEEKREQNEDTSQKRVQVEISLEQQEQECQAREITFTEQDEQENARPDSDC